MTFTFLFILSENGWSGDFEKGLTAAESGDFLTALEEWKPLAEAGDEVAQFNLGLIFKTGGSGVPKRYSTAAKWFRLAAEKGYADAQYNLGWMYDNGHGVAKDYKAAVKWFTFAAEQGDADAQFNLAHHYALGNGVKINYVYAHMWANLAGSIGSEKGVELQNYMERLLNPAQKLKAHELFKKCIRKNYKGC